MGFISEAQMCLEDEFKRYFGCRTVDCVTDRGERKVSQLIDAEGFGIKCKQ